MNIEAKVTAMTNKLLSYFGGLWQRLVQIEDSPHAIAGGVAIGMFFGFTPLLGLKTLLCLLAAAALRCNPIAAVAAVCLHDVLTPLWPFLLRIEFDLGHFLLSHPHQLPEHLATGKLHPADLLKWSTFLGVGLPMLVGSLVLAIPAATAAYFAMRAFLLRRRNHHTDPPNPRR
jgi:hypothetical protein